MIPMHYLTSEDVDLIKELLDMIPRTDKAKLAIDLGAGDGGTALTVLTHRSDFFVYSVDIDLHALERVASLMHSVGCLNRWHSQISRSDRANNTYLPHPISLLMCDATHDYASQQDELNHWLPVLELGTLVWIHEYAGYANISYPGVKIAVDEFIEKGYLRTIKVSGLSWSGIYEQAYRPDTI